MSNDKHITCLYPECEKTSSTRGLCSIHYSYAFRLIQKGKITWKELEDSGKALPKFKVNRSKVTSWFMDKEQSGPGKKERVQEN